jgi:PKD repeat protein
MLKCFAGSILLIPLNISSKPDRLKKTIMKKLLTLLVISIFCFNARSQCSAAFTYTNVGGGQINFQSTSTGTSGATYYTWTFSPGMIAGVAITAPSFTFNYNGIFPVNLAIYDSISQCSASVSINLTVTNVPCNGSVAFNQFLGQNGNVNFANISTGLPQNATWNWNFGDGGTSNLFSPAHTYSASGMYTVTLTGTDQLGICTYSTAQSISVTVQSCSLTSAFSYTSGLGGLVNFTSLCTGTTNTTSYWWNFGDGNSSSAVNPSHTYTSNGSFSVSLSVNDSILFNCNDVSSQLVNYTTCIAYVNFTMAKDSSQLPAIVWDAVPNYPQNILAANWIWGDGSNTTGLYPSHTYSAAGLYSICVSITVSCGATATACYNTNIFRSANAEQSAIAVVHVVSGITGIKTNDPGNAQIILYPNPNNGEFIITSENFSEKTEIVISSVLGNEIYHSSFEENGMKKIKVDGIFSGTYFLKINSAGKTTYKKFVVVK